MTEVGCLLDEEVFLYHLNHLFHSGSRDKCAQDNICNNGRCIQDNKGEVLCICNKGFEKDADDICVRKGTVHSSGGKLGGSKIEKASTLLPLIFGPFNFRPL